MEVGLSIGSNLGDRLSNLLQAGKCISLVPEVNSIVMSPVYETDPVDVPHGTEHLLFLNAVLVIECTLEPLNLLSAMQIIEHKLGRVRGQTNAPRSIDIDIIYVDSRVINEPGLIVPHPRWKERGFVVVPLADLRPELVLPGGGLTVDQIRTRLPSCPAVKVHRKQHTCW